MTDAALRERFREEYARLNGLLYGNRLPPFPGVAVRRMTRSLGRARFRRERDGSLALVGFTLNRAFEARPASAMETIRHEIAHAAAALLRGDPGHGPAWREEAVRCGAAPRACARRGDLPVDLPVRTPLAIVRCGNGACAEPAEVRVFRRTARILRDPGRYRCRSCGLADLRVVA